MLSYHFEFFITIERALLDWKQSVKNYISPLHIYKKTEIEKQIGYGSPKTFSRSKYNFSESFKSGLLVSMFLLTATFSAIKSICEAALLKGCSAIVHRAFLQVTDTHSANFDW